MAPIHSKLLDSKLPSYHFSASRLHNGQGPALLECVAAPPRRARRIQLTITRTFKRNGISLKKTKELKKDTNSSSTARRAPTALRDEGDPLASSSKLPSTSSSKLPSTRENSPLSSLSPSPPPSPSIPVAVALARGEGQSASAPPAPRRPSTSRSAARLTRSASLSTSKATRGSTAAAIEGRLKPDGSIATRFGDMDGEPIFIRQERVTSTVEPVVVTYFWESFTTLPLREPPNLTAYPDLEIGDLYCNIVKGTVKTAQLWIWTAESEGAGTWKRAREGDVREDGRRLTVTPTRMQPSWVSPTWGAKRLRNPKGR